MLSMMCSYFGFEQISIILCMFFIYLNYVFIFNIIFGLFSKFWSKIHIICLSLYIITFVVVMIFLVFIFFEWLCLFCINYTYIYIYIYMCVCVYFNFSLLFFWLLFQTIRPHCVMPLKINCILVNFYWAIQTLYLDIDIDISIINFYFIKVVLWLE